MSILREESTFRPRIHGFHFVNSFDASPAEVAWDRDRCATVKAIVFSGGLAGILAWPESIGLCGGMCWGALDRYFGHREGCIPQDKAPPGLRTPLFRELFDRQLDTLVAHGSLIGRCWDWMNRPDEGHWHDRTSIGHLTQADEWPRTKDLIDRGFPASLCVIKVRGPMEGGGFEVWSNHQVLAWGYEFDDQARRVKLKLYDPNYPDADDVSLSFTLGQDHSKLSAVHSRGDDVRGFFNWSYDKEMILIPPDRALRRRTLDPALHWMLFSGSHLG